MYIDINYPVVSKRINWSRPWQKNIAHSAIRADPFMLVNNIFLCGGQRIFQKSESEVSKEGFSIK